MNRLPPINALRALDAVARHGRFTKAAEELNLTHGAVSKQIRQLEEIYETKLFIRTASEVRLTSDGARIHRTTAEALKTISDTVTERQKDDLAGDLRLLVPPAFSAYWLMPRLTQFVERYPNISLRVQTSPEMIKEPDARTDVTVRYGRPNWPDKNVTLLKNISLFPVCSPKLTVGRNPLTKLADLKRFTLLHEDDGELWAKWLVSAKSGMQTGSANHYIEDVHQLLVAAREGLGIALGDNVTSRHFLGSGELIRPFRNTIRSPYSYYTITGQKPTQRAAAFLEWVSTVE
ncbi:LysR substrate-binding domain-containing protein [Roseibium sp. SCP14]|uniref:LysR substrate-binding domain-containing protein n=1 Tax=Roseibium sp. SCP14 TaxID=3141375 RepID=UPI00333799B7